MLEHELFERRLSEALRGYASEAPTHVESFALARSIAAAHPRHARFSRAQSIRRAPALAVWVVTAMLLLAAAIAIVAGIGSDPSPTPSQYRLSACSDSSQPVAATVLGCSRDGTSFLVQKGNEFLVLRADGSETEVADLSNVSDVGSARPTGATISPDGSRVVYAGLTKTSGEGHRSCHDGALFAVDADGGSAEVIWESQVPQNGIVRDPTFSPDGTHIAFVDGYCDSDHSVWVMNADGSDAHRIVSSDMGPLSATHVHGLAWSPAGDRIAIKVDQGTFSFASDGSDFKASGSAGFCWPGRQCSAGIR